MHSRTVETRTDWRARSSEIGYWVAPWARGHGLAAEAVEAVARWLLLEQRFERMVQGAATGNRASQRVAEKSGMTREGVARNAGFTNAGRVDLVVFSFVSADLAAGDASVGEHVTSWFRRAGPSRCGRPANITRP